MLGDFKMVGFIFQLGWSLNLHATTCSVEVQHLTFFSPDEY